MLWRSQPKHQLTMGKIFMGVEHAFISTSPEGAGEKNAFLTTSQLAELEKLEERVRQRAAERKATAEKANAFAVSADVKPVDKIMKLADSLSKEERMDLSLLLAK